MSGFEPVDLMSQELPAGVVVLQSVPQCCAHPTGEHAEIWQHVGASVLKCFATL